MSMQYWGNCYYLRYPHALVIVNKYAHIIYVRHEMRYTTHWSRYHFHWCLLIRYGRSVRASSRPKSFIRFQWNVKRCAQARNARTPTRRAQGNRREALGSPQTSETINGRPTDRRTARLLSLANNLSIGIVYTCYSRTMFVHPSYLRSARAAAAATQRKQPFII